MFLANCRIERIPVSRIRYVSKYLCNIEEEAVPAGGIQFYGSSGCPDLTATSSLGRCLTLSKIYALRPTVPTALLCRHRRVLQYSCFSKVDQEVSEAVIGEALLCWSSFSLL